VVILILQVELVAVGELLPFLVEQVV
jgi:hypothetical protein